MKRSLLYLLAIVFFWTCQSDVSKQQASKPSSVNVKPEQLQLQPVEATVYQTALRSNHSSSIEQLCEDSKGYRRNEWQGLNECDWVIENQLLSKDMMRAKRNEDVLSLKLDNKQWIDITHNPEGIYYRYKGYLSGISKYLVLISPADDCPAFWLINSSDGGKQKIEGLPYFSANGHQAIVTSGGITPSKACNSQLEHWQFTNNEFQQQSTLTTQNRVTEKLFWKGDKEVLLRQSALDSDKPTEYYARIKL